VKENMFLGCLTHQVQMFQQNIIHCDHSLTATTDQPTHTFASLSITDFIMTLNKTTSDHQQKKCVVTHAIVLLTTYIMLSDRNVIKFSYMNTQTTTQSAHMRYVVCFNNNNDNNHDDNNNKVNLQVPNHYVS